MTIYIDHNATTPLRAEVREAMAPYLEGRFGNASSVHTFGREAAKGLNRAREQVAAALGCAPEEIVFTGGRRRRSHRFTNGGSYWGHWTSIDCCPG